MAPLFLLNVEICSCSTVGPHTYPISKNCQIHNIRHLTYVMNLTVFLLNPRNWVRGFTLEVHSSMIGDAIFKGPGRAGAFRGV
jgi:hypothetical protein